ncbi:MAG TPA: rhodanese-like domain-containing protein [Thermoanaerobaculia bacterium]|jgi:rhodanese-related sulfurtransferase
MNRRFWLEAATLVIAAVICALVSNALAGRERKMALKGNYPNALKVPQETIVAPPSVAPPTSAAVVPVPAPVTTTVATALEPAPATTKTTKATAPPATAPPATGNRQPATQTPDIAKFTPHPDKAYTEIAYADVANLHAAGVLFLDARRTSVYEQGHIAGARSYSVWESDIDDKVNKLFNERSSEADQAKPIVVYCSGGECEDSHMLAQKLWGIQFNNVYVYKDGFPDWQQHGAAVHTGSAP